MQLGAFWVGRGTREGLQTGVQSCSVFGFQFSGFGGLECGVSVFGFPGLGLVLSGIGFEKGSISAPKECWGRKLQLHERYVEHPKPVKTFEISLRTPPKFIRPILEDILQVFSVPAACRSYFA